MNERMRESLSALLDGESNELELERILSRVGADQELRLAWMRFAVARQALHGHHVEYLQRDISQRVQRELGSVPTGAGATATMLRQRLLRPLTSVAVAASVALTVVLGGKQIAELGSVPSYDSEDRAVAASASPVGMLNSLGATTVQASYGTRAVPVSQSTTRSAYQELAQQRLRKYMQEHAEQAALNAPQGLVPFARVPEIRE